MTFFRTARFVLTIEFVLITAPRLPAPIQETTESPTPTPTVKPEDTVMTPNASPSSGFAWPGELFPETRSRLLKPEDLRVWDAEKLRYAINEMYARGGYDFRSPEIKQIFMRLPWYRDRLVSGRTQDEATAHLSPLERANLELLQKARRVKQ